MTTVISVRFRNGCKAYYFDPRDLTVEPGMDVIVETAQGPEFVQCVEGNHEVEDDAVVEPLRPVLRIATENDRHTAAYNRGREKEAFEVCQKKIAQHGLEMKLVRAECSFDGSKILFFFTADGRVDFRELVKDLASVFRSRIELRQIGVRDEAKMLGGLGICGRPFCCSAYLDDFLPVSIKMAKTQNLSLNPTKISGTCGRLMCCLNYEQAAYEDALSHLPKPDSFVLTPDGPGNVADVNLLKETVNVHLDSRPDTSTCYHNCEVCILRNGKGSRDGIVIPDKRPARYVVRAEQEELPVAEWIAEEKPNDEISEKADYPRRHRSHSSRKGKANTDTANTERAEKAPSDPSAANPAGKSASSSRRRHRGGHHTAKADPTTQALKAPEAPGGEGKKKPRLRGGRHHSKREQGSGSTGA